MQFYYGDKSLLRALDEAEFWKHQETEHTTVVKMAAPGLEPAYKRALDQYETIFNKTHAILIRYTESAVRSDGCLNAAYSKEIEELIAVCVRQSKQFVNFLQSILKKSAAVIENDTAVVVINHIIRESEYFIGIVQLIL